MAKMIKCYPGANPCLGREDLCGNIVTKALEGGFCLFFGGRKSGKRTVLRHLAENWSTSASADQNDAVQLATLIDLSETKRFQTDEELFRFALERFRELVIARIEGISLPPTQPVNPHRTGADWFFAEVDRVIASAPALQFSILFLIHRPELLFDWGFDNQIFRNALNSVRYQARPSNGSVGIVFSGGRRLYDLCYDQSSPIGTIAGREFAFNLQQDAIIEMVRSAGCHLGEKVQKRVAAFFFKAAGGQPHLTRCLCQALARAGKRFVSDAALKQHCLTVAAQNHEQFRIWIADLGDAARGDFGRVAFDVLLVSEEADFATIEEALQKRNLDLGFAERAARQCAFSGIASYDNSGGLKRLNKLFWQYADNTLKGLRRIPSVKEMANSQSLKKLIVHTNSCLIEVNGAPLKKISVSQYALIRTLAEHFTLDNPAWVKQSTVLDQTVSLLKELAHQMPQHFNEKEERAWSGTSDQKCGENRQLWADTKNKLKLISEPLFLAFPDRSTLGGYRLQIKSNQVKFVSVT